jgi:hypothetical protein
VLGSQAITHSWATVTHGGGVWGAVVIAGPPTFNDGDQGVVRVQSVGPGSFQLRFQEWLYLDGTHATEVVPFLVLEAGRHHMADGSIWEVGTFDLSGNRTWSSETFVQPFPEAPRLLLTIQTYNEVDTVKVRARSVTATGFEAALSEEDALQNGHATEVVGYLAIWSPSSSGTVVANGSGTSYSLASASVNHSFSTVLGHSFKVEEEQSLDSEVTHAYETLDVLVLGGQPFAQDVTCNGGDNIALRRQ